MLKPPTSRLLELRLENYKKFCSPSKLRRSTLEKDLGQKILVDATSAFTHIPARKGQPW